MKLRGHRVMIIYSGRLTGDTGSTEALTLPEADKGGGWLLPQVMALVGYR
jgi:hypothetical protein